MHQILSFTWQVYFKYTIIQLWAIELHLLYNELHLKSRKRLKTKFTNVKKTYNKWGEIKIDINNLIFEPCQVKDVIGLNGFKNKGLVSFVANDSKGILPHEIPNGSFIFVRPEDDYNIGDFIVVYKNEPLDKDFKIKKAEEKEPLYFGRIIMTAKSFLKEDL